jgi:predicted phosphodiesterase
LNLTKAKQRAADRAATKITMVMGDVHLPQHDPKSVDIAIEWLNDHPVDTVILNGDIIDCYEISRFAQPGSPGPGLAEELRQGRKFLGRVRAAAGRNAEIVFIEGNHEFRFRSYLANVAPAIVGLDHNITIEDQLHFEKYGITYVPSKGERWFSTYIEAAPNVLVGHFNKISINAGYAVKGLLDKYGASIITGHGHCMGVSHRRHHKGNIHGYEGGCLCDLNPPYCEPSHWAQGFIVIHELEGIAPQIERVLIQDHSFVYGGIRYRGV